MRSLISFFSVLSVCWARAQIPGDGGLHVEPVQSVDSHIIGGIDGVVGEIPSLLSLELSNGVQFLHHCGATLLNANYALTSTKCVLGLSAASLRVVAGLYYRNDYTGTQTSAVANYNTHELYNPGTEPGQANDANDIAVLRLATPISVVAGRIEYAKLAVDNGNNFAGTACVIAGWGSVDSSGSQPVTLQKASIPVITQSECEAYLPGFQIWADHICAKDPPSVRGACDGDFGGPLVCPDFTEGPVIAGVGSWVVRDGNGACDPQYPSVYTRVTSYLAWIQVNTPPVETVL